jgi:hypothetical protein
MRTICLLAACLISIAGFAQQDYWQQEVSYDMNVSLNDKSNSLKGSLDLEYTNHSPDALDFIWFHLWPNAYKNENTAFAKQLMQEKDGKKRWKDMKEKGWIDSLNFTSGGQKLRTEAHPEYIDVVKVFLPSTLKSGEKIKISTPFHVKLPSYNSRSGFEGQSYMVCQWYPKPAVYDRKGWHPMPYLDQGEFYSEFGTFKVNITVPSDYIVGATGTLQTASELNQYKEIGKQNVASSSLTNVKPYKVPSTPTKTLTYTASNVHDFAWFADQDFVIRYDTMLLPSGRIVDVFAWHQPKGNKHWVDATNYIESGSRAYSSWLGEYAYPVVQAVEGPGNDMSGGMEYPMITLITSPKADVEELDAVITHEVGHNWFYGMLASNERVHPWMDEGMNTYLQFRYEAEKYKANSIFGSAIPSQLKQLPTDEFLSMVYNALGQISMEDAIETHSADYKNKDRYGLGAYLKPSIWMYAMELNVGREKLQKGLQDYFAAWQFRHPYPEDLKASLEKSTGLDLTAYFDLLRKKGSL